MYLKTLESTPNTGLLNQNTTVYNIYKLKNNTLSDSFAIDFRSEAINTELQLKELIENRHFMQLKQLILHKKSLSFSGHQGPKSLDSKRKGHFITQYSYAFDQFGLLNKLIDIELTWMEKEFLPRLFFNIHDKYED